MRYKNEKEQKLSEWFREKFFTDLILADLFNVCGHLVKHRIDSNTSWRGN
jgi:hypothetical protein